MTEDYYKLLGLSKTANPDEIKKAFRKLAHQHHPDKAGGNEQKFKEINEAYQVLSNPEKRRQYDQYGQTFEQVKAQGGFGGGSQDFSDFASAFRNGNNGQNFSFEFSDLGDVFGDLFGGRTGRTKTGARTRRGADVEVNLAISFKEAVFGVEKSLRLTKEEPCAVCSGNGVEPGSKLITCQTCKGTGQVVRSIGFGIGFPSVCPECSGQGQKAEKQCRHCRGQGVEKKDKEIKVKIPAGIDDGQGIKLTAKGQAGLRGGTAGDLYLRIRVLPDREFSRQGFDILSQIEISVSLAALGGLAEVNTLEGKVNLKIPEGTQSGKVFQLTGYGVPHLHGRGKGNQLVEVIVKTPTNLSHKQKDLLKELGL
ncbi:MAG: molecular chaperone DnaJ [Candidatus Buchananbacteria bacterium RIFCSPHIGHO2_01_FULL_44_11]|uniref:Chaperone protein DnaJ n=1 Tax=Candidatus Buchananbacteria bacterium RIFCSPHIGHO2_01_FULL_44_11 TaxID=1797535 RepID=A0A1G1Y240_9BACT|nr:MAG: molecular chaperone DnaJ [Candidatus Buchananbacteria bacterium RIFCSPHIGHO2_01_FULL_44_11]